MLCIVSFSRPSPLRTASPRLRAGYRDRQRVVADTTFNSHTSAIPLRLTLARRASSPEYRDGCELLVSADRNSFAQMTNSA
jgi:hypothetical protein